MYRGRVQNGVVVFEGPKPPEGQEVRVDLLEGRGEGGAQQPGTTPLADELLKLSGIVSGLPSDLARNHDHYLHGQPKR